ncbi:plipastatin synthase subunit D [Ruminiclostridium hungatei]|uniref:Plipastatin synthase subunit D n=1 Tax=Ruminiclostridium hungatei TaxID=48256 RepID=A0A1V4SPG1_RUMHU|nr:non-ribosomal peptide synthetase [Ruminiclostridium hungatei]OPX45137.1 plipastatin synthase subunit D [Ruminiclostridium hungatei]
MNGKTINVFFEEQVKKTPDRIAVEDCEQFLTYSQLNKKSNQLARVLLEEGVKNEDIVAVIMERNINMIISILAVIKAGAAYLPVNKDYPRERIGYMLENSGTKVSLVSGTVDLPDWQGSCIDVGTIELEGEDTNLNLGFPSSSLAYVIYTSGSTGMPKGVMIEHHSVINRLVWMQNQYKISEHDILLQKTPFTFDVSVWEIFLWFFAGSRLFLYQHGRESDVECLIKTIEERNITICHFVPSMLNVFLEYAAHKNCSSRLKSLKKVYASGEALSFAVVEKFEEVLYRTNHTELHNLYGPTEATVDVTYFDCTAYSCEKKIIPIGRPISNTDIYILDENQRLCRPGDAGEIYITGQGVGRGYINNPKLTDERFLDNPFCIGERMFRSGDLGRWSNNQVEYIGRIDNQVKIRGNRVELEEIECVLQQHEAVLQAIACMIDNNGSIYLTVFYKSKKQLNPSEVKSHLLKKLPDYMIPDEFVETDTFLYTSSGKIDRRGMINNYLSSHCAKTHELHENKEPAPVEKILLLQMEKLLNRELMPEIVMNSSISDIGIDSIMFVTLIINLEARFNIEFDEDKQITRAFPTIRDISEYVKSKLP